MTDTYPLSGLPSDILNSDKIGTRRLKVEAVILDGELEAEKYIKKEFFYLGDGNIDYIKETNLNTNAIIHKTFLWTNGTLTSITPQIQ